MDLAVGMLLCAIGLFVAVSTFRMYRALNTMMKPTLKKAHVLLTFREFAGADGQIDSAELAAIFLRLGHDLTRFELEAAMLDMDENDNGELSANV
jgi:Ca2+-binding EF-hand superfamily protein